MNNAQVVPATIYKLSHNTPRNINTLYKYRASFIESMSLLDVVVDFRCGVHSEGVTTIAVAGFNSKTDEDAQKLFLLCCPVDMEQCGKDELAIEFYKPRATWDTEPTNYTLIAQ